MGRKKNEEIVLDEQPVLGEKNEVVETESNEVLETVAETEKELPIYVPDIPAQMEEVQPTSNLETEIEFLNRLKQFQRNGGWGRHLEPMINERISILQNT